ncbi:hypothetical protein [Amorphus sp. 3PC139-8]|uniref:hypothetical protein n=1 Tax=Amorphus sp. 3PC139-8 TaxID=2735676 RepID=UPI00345DB5F1
MLLLAERAALGTENGGVKRIGSTIERELCGTKTEAVEADHRLNRSAPKQTALLNR